jgi:limonene-1,2-epoxide hydrolase
MIDRRTLIAASAAGLAAPTLGATTMSRYAQFRAVIDLWQKKDAQGVLARMTDDIVWHMAATSKPPLVGKAAAAKFLAGFGANIADTPGSIRWRIIHHAETADRLFVEGVDEYDDINGRTITAPYMGVIEFRGDKISGWRDYVDYGTIDAQRRGEALPPHVRELAIRPATP